MTADAAREGRGDPRIAQVDSGNVEIGFGLVNGGGGRIALGQPFLDAGLGTGTLFDQTHLAVVFLAVAGELRPLLRQRRLGQFDIGHIRCRFDYEQYVTLVDDAAVLEIHRLQIAGHTRHQIHGGHRAGRAGLFQVIRHGPDDRPGNFNRRGGRGLVAVVRILAGGQGKQEREYCGTNASAFPNHDALSSHGTASPLWRMDEGCGPLRRRRRAAPDLEQIAPIGTPAHLVLDRLGHEFPSLPYLPATAQRLVDRD
jgi:hypothetical protein